jgi:hypothetical protein
MNIRGLAKLSAIQGVQGSEDESYFSYGECLLTVAQRRSVPVLQVWLLAPLGD